MPKREPNLYDASAFAAFRWHANRLENVAISKYATRPEAYKEILAVLSRAAKELGKLNSLSGQMCTVDDDCYPGYHCNNGDCEPDNLKA